MDVIWPGIKDGLSDNAIRVGAGEAFVRKWEEETGKSPHDIGDDPDELRMVGPRTPSIAMEIIAAYIEHRRKFIEECELLAIELPFAVPLGGDEGTAWYVGRLDKVVRKGGRIYGIEHKTTTWGSKNTGFNRHYLEGFTPDTQIDGYTHAMRMLYGKEFKSIYVDAILVNAYIYDCFKLIPIERATAHIEAWFWETNKLLENIENEKKSLQLTGLEETGSFLRSFPKDRYKCDWCPYIDICKMHPDPECLAEPPKGFREKKWEPFDLLHLDSIGMEK